MITKEEFEKAVKYCTEFTINCINCKDCPLSKKDLMCGAYFAEYIKNEPALSANSTSSTKKENTFQVDDSTKEQICQAYETADEACTNMLTVYEGMSECEQRAFDIGEAYGKIFSTKCKLERLIGASGREGE